MGGECDNFFYPSEKWAGDFLRHCRTHGSGSRFDSREMRSKISTLLLRRMGTLWRRTRYEGEQKIIVQGSFTDEMSSAIYLHLSRLNQTDNEARERKVLFQVLAAEFCDWYLREGSKYPEYNFLRIDAKGDMYIPRNCR